MIATSAIMARREQAAQLRNRDRALAAALAINSYQSAVRAIPVTERERAIARQQRASERASAASWHILSIGSHR